ncbi:MAG: TetR/AcrR family transcriptional regulator [Gemmatimonadota bacterium]|nr:TetR/AcrR family transcriptional regulator [Gemmatimonadota bacterium]
MDSIEAPNPAIAENSEPKRRRAPEERPQQILDAAFHEFGESGLAGARLDDIAKRANVAKGTIYLYFPNKEELFREMVRQSMVQALDRNEEILRELADESATVQLSAVFQAWWSFLRSDRFAVVHRLVIGELHHFPDLMQFYADEVILRGRRVISSVVSRGIERGEFRTIDPDIAARMLSALGVSHSIWCTRRNFFPALALTSDQDLGAELLDFYLHALRP